MLIAQISDPHLMARGQLCQGRIDTNAMFAAALETLAGLDPQPDLVLLTGDLVDIPNAPDYAAASELLGTIRPRLLAIPGNHDGREPFRQLFGSHLGLATSGPVHFAADDFGPVRILGFDITVPGHHHGDADGAALAWLAARLDEAPDRPTLVIMHQPPILTGIGFLDPYRCFGAEALDGLLRNYSNVERVLCGHVHRHMVRSFGGTILMTAPSTSSSIALRLAPGADVASFIEPPGLLLHHWQGPGQLVSHLVPIGRFEGPLPFF